LNKRTLHDKQFTQGRRPSVRVELMVQLLHRKQTDELF